MQKTIGLRERETHTQREKEKRRERDLGGSVGQQLGFKITHDWS